MCVLFKRLFIVYSFIYFLFLVSAFCFFKKGESVNYAALFFGLLFLMILFFIKEYKIDPQLFKSWAKPSNLFVLSFVIVNFQTIISVWLNYETIGTYLETSKYSGYIGKVLYCGLIGMTTYLLGYSYYNKRPVKNIKKGKIRNYNIHKWALLSLVVFLMFVVNIDLVSFLTGMDYDGSGAADREITPSAIWENFFDTFMTVTVASMTIRCIREEKQLSLFQYMKAYPFYFLLPVLLYIVLRLVSGDRGPVIYTCLLFFYSYLLASQNKIKLSILILLILFGAFGMSLLNSARSYRNPNQSFLERISRGLSDKDDEGKVKTVSPLTYELSKSVNCNFIAVHDIDENVTDYKYGLYNFCEILCAVPGMNRITTEFLDLNIYRTATTEYVTISFAGKNYFTGLGTTVITDFYLDFGLWGIIVGLFIVGLVYKRIDVNLVYGSIPSFFAMVFFLKFASMSVYIPRASFSFVLCRVLYIMIFYFVLNSLFNLFRFRKSTN